MILRCLYATKLQLKQKMKILIQNTPKCKQGINESNTKFKKLNENVFHFRFETDKKIYSFQFENQTM